MRTAELLEKALGLIEKPGTWLKERLWNNEGTAFCAVGALSFALVDQRNYVVMEDERLATQHLSHVIQEQFPERLDGYYEARHAVVVFNNHPDTTHDDIIAVFEKAYLRALEAEAGEE